MKHSMNSMIIVLLLSCGLHTDFISAVTKIAPIGEGEYSIVNAIKQYSNLTEGDINRYKSLQFGGLVTFGALLLGAASTIGAGAGVYKSITPDISTAIKSWKSERLAGIENWLADPLVLAGLGSVGAGLVVYQAFNSSTREEIENNILKKVQKYLDMCEALEEDSHVYSKDQPINRNPNDKPVVYNIFNCSFQKVRPLPEQDLGLLRAYLPTLWPHDDDVAVYRALYNLQEQGRRAKLLLNYLGFDDDVINKKRTLLDKYYNTNLSDNVKLYKLVINEQKQEEIRDAELAGIQAGTSLMKAKTFEIYGSMLTNTIQNTWNGLKYIYENKEAILTKAAIASAAAVGMYAYIKSKLGYSPEAKK